MTHFSELELMRSKTVLKTCEVWVTPKTHKLSPPRECATSSSATWSRENRRLAVVFDAHFVERSSSFAVYPLNLTKQLFTRGTLKPSYLHVLYVEFQCNMVLISVELGLATVK